MSSIKKLASDTLWYGVSSILGRFVYYLLTPLHTTVLSEAQYGTLSNLYAYVAFFNIIYLLGLETAFFRFANKSTYNPNQVFNQTFSLILLFTIPLTVQFFIFADAYAAFAGFEGAGLAIRILSVNMLIDTILALPLSRLRFENKAKKFAFARVTGIVVNLAINLIVLLGFEYLHKQNTQLGQFVSLFYNTSHREAYIFMANVIGNLATLALANPRLLKIKINVNATLAKQMLIYSLPLMFASLSGMINEMFGRAFFKELLPNGFYKNLTNIEALGVFSGVFKLSVFITLTVQAFRYAADPFFFSKASDKNSPETFAQVMRWFNVATGILFVLVVANTHIIGRLFLGKSTYWSALDLVPILLLNAWMLGVYYNLSAWYKLTDKTHLGLIITLIGAALTLILNILLIPIAGWYGSALSTTVAYITMLIITYYQGKKYFDVPYQLLSAARVFGGAILLAFTWLVASKYNITLASLITNILAMGYIIYILKTEGITIRVLKSLILRKK